MAEDEDLGLDEFEELLNEPLLPEEASSDTFLKWVLLNADEISYNSPKEATAAPAVAPPTSKPSVAPTSQMPLMGINAMQPMLPVGFVPLAPSMPQMYPMFPPVGQAQQQQQPPPLGSAAPPQEAAQQGAVKMERPAAPNRKRPAVGDSLEEGEGGRGSVSGMRKKKKPKMEELQVRLAKVKAENRELKHHLTNVEERHRLLDAEKKAMENLIRKQLEATQCGTGDPSELARIIQNFKDLYADYGPQRQKECNFHMDQLERLLIPTQTTKMSLWTMEQPASFFDDPNKNSLGAILKRELGVTSEQRERISSLRARVREAVRDLRAAMSFLRDLRGHINHKHSSFDVRMRELQDILTPTQAAKLILWVRKNRHKVRNGLNLTAKDMFGAGIEYSDGDRVAKGADTNESKTASEPSAES
mmetsp:Transcript_4721/g.18880  ORF Transcript_4721/g.18880 Transcript_4721/m.18880 type:complete len:417 (+) Transcript_4721:71-1321(+)